MEADKKEGEAQIYLLTGFFGAGKTSLIRRVLSDPHSEKYAVIQNQFAEGEMGIEQPLIMDQSGTPFSSFLELPNGCICCSAKNDLVAAIEYIIANTSVRKILVQTNGMADPVQSIKQFWFDEEALIRAQLHSVVCLVSAHRWGQDSGKELFERQVAVANLVVVGFVDKVTEEQYGKVVERVRQLNFQCLIQRNDIKDITSLFKGKSLFSRQSLLDVNTEKVSHHGKSLRPVYLKGQSLLTSQLEIEQALGELLWESGLKVMRVKGVVCLKGQENVFELQGVEDVFEVKPTNSSTKIYEKETRILVIGQGLEQQKLYEMLKVKKSQKEQK